MCVRACACVRVARARVCVCVCAHAPLQAQPRVIIYGTIESSF